MLSKASKYVISAVLYMTKNATLENKLGSLEIAKRLNIPAPFLAKSLQKLSKKGIISSVKGPNGGFYLSNENKDKTLFDVIDCVDSVEKFNQCYLGHEYCNEENPCVVHFLYAPFKSTLITKLKTKTILQMAEEYQNNTNFTLKKRL
ncbi:RrF2 family transcriptional regulator [Polaribacter gangjinensis]|uniref:Transcriptional regulator n=1 Tax=Polaribacter gangjinensis TaxID=574710 RepID=A0A2S7W9U3_9FLAO|nr:Rrf2 family transcriptional regulator [Polaribacter gangjinensis]PQJ74385.1 hypothetical protein BTO13_03455 [Polaribacter gangjinensis]